MNASNHQAEIEAILFAAGEPINIKRLAQATGLNIEQTQEVLQNLETQLNDRQSGLCLVKMQDKYQLCTRTEFAQQIRDVLDLKRNAPLSQAAFEVLAVVAYNQPVTKSFVEQVRGVDCSGVMTTLCQKGLVEEKGRLDLPGRPLIYGTTPEFLRCFCISSLDELPPVPQCENLVEMESESTEENDENVERGA
ncbi:MAG: SMC-Scp complex subunit ScpB [Acutalibacteraceae bacterium]|nr:SMC-Scp complex subunit ScpB [Clostridiales bacterium]